MPFPTAFFLVFATGLAAALSARAELRVSPRPPWLTRSFASYLVFAGLLFVPITVYFYLFHGDWFLLYLFDVGRIPSAIALMGFICEAALGALGFSVGASLVRGQREKAAIGVMSLSAVLALAVPMIVHERLSVVGTFAQYRGGFGLVPFNRGALFQGTLLMWLWLLLGLGFLLFRLNATSRPR